MSEESVNPMTDSDVGRPPVTRSGERMIVPRDLGIQAALHCMRSGSKWSAFRSPISSPTHGRGPPFGRVRLVRKRIGI